jgi:hypothetical protein
MKGRHDNAGIKLALAAAVLVALGFLVIIGTAGNVQGSFHAAGEAVGGQELQPLEPIHVCGAREYWSEAAGRCMKKPTIRLS